MSELNKSGPECSPVDLSSDIPPSRGICVAKTSMNLGPVDLSSDIPPVEASSGHKQYYVRSA